MTPYDGPDRRRDHDRRAEFQRLLDASARDGQRRRRRESVTEVLRNLALIAIMLFVGVTSWPSRVALNDNARAGCVRGADSYLTNAAAWRNEADNWQAAAKIRRADGDTAVADTYAANARDTLTRAMHLEQLAGVSEVTAQHAPRVTQREIKATCNGRYPSPPLVSLRG